MMTPRMTTCGPFAVLGLASRIRRGSESPERFGRIWRILESRRQEITPVATQKVCVGASFPTEEEGVTEYLAGMIVPARTPSPEGLAARTISGGRCAVFECPVEAIGATYQRLFSVWLPGAAGARRQTTEEGAVDIGLIGGIVGGALGLAGGAAGTYFSIKNTQGPRERSFVITASVITWIAVSAFLVGLMMLPKPYNYLLWLPYGIALPLGIRWWNQRQLGLRKEEAAGLAATVTGAGADVTRAGGRRT